MRLQPGLIKWRKYVFGTGRVKTKQDIKDKEMRALDALLKIRMEI